MFQPVSIIVPVYQTEKYVAKCLDSIVNQTYNNIELIVVNDGSQDSSRLIIENYACRYKCIKTIHQENKGLSAARNNGLKAANGYYIIFVDSDDWLDINAVKDLVTLANDNNADIVVPKKNYFVDERISNSVTVELFDASSFDQNNPKDYVIEVLLGQARNWSVTRGALYRSDIINKWNIVFPDGLTGEDIIFNLRYFCYVKNIVFNGIAHYYYLKRKGSISHSYNKKLIDIFLCIDLEVKKYIDFCCEKNERALLARDSLLSRNVVLYLNEFILAEYSKTFKNKRNDFLNSINCARITEAFKNKRFIVPYWPSCLAKYYIVFIRWLLSKRLYTLAIIIVLNAGNFYKRKRNLDVKIH